MEKLNAEEFNKVSSDIEGSGDFTSWLSKFMNVLMEARFKEFDIFCEQVEVSRLSKFMLTAICQAAIPHQPYLKKYDEFVGRCFATYASRYGEKEALGAFKRLAVDKAVNPDVERTKALISASNDFFRENGFQR